MKFVKVLIFCLISFGAKTQFDSLDGQILELLVEQTTLLDEISYTVIQEDYARIRLIKKAITDVENNIKDNKEKNIAPITMQTFFYMQRLMIQYRHSKEFFGWSDEPSYLSIHTPITEEAINMLYESYQTTLNVYGFNEDPSLTITKDTFFQIEKSLRSLISMVSDLEVKNKLENLFPLIGRTIVKAHEGDNFCTFAVAKIAIDAIREIYSDFYQLTDDTVARELIFEIQGQTGFYAEYSKVDRANEGASCQE